MRIPRSRGAVSGLLLMILGAWGALVPFIGPYFDLVIGPDDTWNWSSDRFWLSVVPGIVAFVGGLILMQSAHRGGAGLGAWMGILAGAWFALGPLISRLWTSDGASALGQPAGGTNRQVLEMLVMYSGLGVLITAVAAFALGRLAVRSVRDVELARERELEAERERTAAVPVVRDRDRDRDPDLDRDVDRTRVLDRDHDHDHDHDQDRDRDGGPDEQERFRRQPEADHAPAPTTAAAPTAVSPREPVSRQAADQDLTAVDSTRPIATTPQTAETRRSGGLLGRLRRS
jgi:hypothetical protein